METKNEGREALMERTMPERSDRRLRYVAAMLAFASLLFHLWALQEEFLFRPLSGFLLFLVAVGQGLLAASLLFGPGRWMVRFGILLNACVVLSWAVTRFVGYPGLLGFSRLPVEPLNLAATAAEIALLVLLLRVDRRIGNRVGMP